MITQREISQIAYREQVSDKVIEKDYVLTWLLFGLAESKLKESLAFKGGTALKKIYFPEYRYSEDLDFTVLKTIDPEELISDFQKILDSLSKRQGFQFAISEKKIEKRTDSLTIYVDFVGPLGARLGSRDVKVDFTLNEKLVYALKDERIMSDYSDTRIDNNVKTYALEEILVEKLCAIMGRTEPRDLYDAEFVFGSSVLDDHNLAHAFNEKAEFKNLDSAEFEIKLQRKKATLERMWETRLRHQVKDLPKLDDVLRSFNRHLRQHIR